MIRIAMPNKGRLAEPARDLLEAAGLRFAARGSRALQARLGDQFLALFVRAEDIPEFVADGAADLGITGRDLVAGIIEMRILPDGRATRMSERAAANIDVEAV